MGVGHRRSVGRLDPDVGPFELRVDAYAAKGERTLRNDGDGIYAQSGDQLTLDVGGSGAAYSSTFEIGIQV